MGMLYSGKVETMMPKLHSKNFEGMELIRPMYMVREADIKAWRDYNHLTLSSVPAVSRKAVLPAAVQRRLQARGDQGSDPELRKKNPYIEKNIFRSVENVNLNTVIGYKKDGVRHHFLDEYDKA